MPSNSGSVVDSYPTLGDHFALRLVGCDIRYLVNARTGTYYELEPIQLDALKMADGSKAVGEIAQQIAAPVAGVAAFFASQRANGIVSLAPSRTSSRPNWYRYCEPPHLSDVLIEVTGFCNLKCAHCFNADFNTKQAIAREMTTDELVRLIEELDALNVRRIQLSGGEATLRKDLWDIIDAIDEHRIFLDVLSTNATTITAKNVERLANRFSQNGALYISMDGLTADTYEVLRGEGVFPRFERAMRLLDEHGCRIFINTMAVRSNLHQMDGLYDWMASHPAIKGWRIGLPKVLGRYQQNHEELEVEFEEVIQIFKRLLKRWLTDRPPFRMELSDFFRTDTFECGLENHQLHDNPCKYAVTNMSIKPDGTAVFCASLEIHEPAVLGNVVKQGLAGVWYGARHTEFRKAQVRDLPVCSNCRYLHLCGGGCRSNALLSYGDITAADPRACAAMQLLEGEIVPELPEQFQDGIYALIDRDKPFAPPRGYKRYI